MSKKENNITPKIRQRRLAKALILNSLADVPVTQQKVLESVRYPETSATQPGRIIAQRGTQIALQEESKTLLDAAKKKGLTPDKIINKINTLLDAEKITKTIRDGNVITQEEEEDKQAIDKGLTHALKIGVGGGYAAEKQEHSGSVEIDITNDQLKRIARTIQQG